MSYKKAEINFELSSKGVKVGIEQNGSRVDLALWREAENNRWKTLKSQDIPTLQTKKPATSRNQENPSQTEEKLEALKTVKANSTSNNSGNSSNEGNKN